MFFSVLRLCGSLWAVGWVHVDAEVGRKDKKVGQRLYWWEAGEVGALVMKDERRYTPGGFGRRDHGGTLSLREMGGWF